MDALELLKTDHKKVKELFKKAEGNENQKQQKQLFEQIKTELETHTRIASRRRSRSEKGKIHPPYLLRSFSWAGGAYRGLGRGRSHLLRGPAKTERLSRNNSLSIKLLSCSSSPSYFCQVKYLSRRPLALWLC